MDAEKRVCALRSDTRYLVIHILILIAGTGFLLIDAFHGNVWFDESYSLGIVKHSFAEIWTIGSGDVHPVLFYWALHVIYLIFGQNILAYRLFTVAGSVALAALGLVQVRKDFGERVGFIFSFLALFTPYIAQMSVEIRMYSWVTFAVMLCALYAYRIVACLCKTVPARIADHARGKRMLAHVPVRWWIVFGVASLASAYLHYYGTLSAFMINLLLMLFIVTRPRGHRGRALAVFAVQAIVQVALFFPWLQAAVLSQMGVVSGTYWAKVSLPTFIELFTYTVVTSQVSFALRGEYGIVLQVVLIALMACLVLLSLLIVASFVRKKRAARREAKSADQPGLWHRFVAWARQDEVAPFLGALGVYVAVILFSLIVSLIMNSLIMYYRYLFSCIGPFLLFIAGVLAKVRPKQLCWGVCSIVLIISAINMACLVGDDYNPENQEALTAFEEASQESDLIISSDIGYMGVTSVLYPGIHQTYMDWQKGNWDEAYLAYAPTMNSVRSWESVLDDYHGTFVVLGQSATDTMPRDIKDLSAKQGYTLDSYQMYYRPYERTWFAIAIMEKE